MSNWQPIETAPKDRRILLYYPKQLHLAEGIVQIGLLKDGVTVSNAPRAIAWQELPVFDGVTNEKL